MREDTVGRMDITQAHPEVAVAITAFEATITAMPQIDGAAVRRTLAWAIFAHRTQIRPDGRGTPYIVHPLEVATRAARWWPAIPTDAVAAALLHDTVEDQGAALIECAARDGSAVSDPVEALRGAFGDVVATLVAALTSSKQAGTPDARAAAYARHVIALVREQPVAGLIKLADFWSNALTVDQVQDVGKRAKLTAKYRPCVEGLMALLPTLPASDPVTASIDHRLAELREAWARAYA